MTKQKLLLFDGVESNRRKEAGMSFSAGASNSLDTAREIAVSLAKSRDDRCVTADDVGESMDKLRMTPLGPAAGSLFSQKCNWEFTGRRVRSTRVSNHARELKVWRYIGEDVKP